MESRSTETEILDDPDLRLPDHVLQKTYQDLYWTNRFLGNISTVLRLLRNSPVPPNRVLDIGCGQGALLVEIQKRLKVDVVGFDLRPAPSNSPIPIFSGNAIQDPLPGADVAVAVCLVHHLSEDELILLIRNVARTSRRFIILDLVRHRVPLLLFQTFLAPLLSRVNALDGAASVRRAYTPAEIRRVVETALEGTGGRLARHEVAPFYIRQVVDIQW